MDPYSLSRFLRFIVWSGNPDTLPQLLGNQLQPLAVFAEGVSESGVRILQNKQSIKYDKCY